MALNFLIVFQIIIYIINFIVKILKSERVANGFNACRNAKKKTYEYKFYLAETELPLKERYSVWLDRAPDLSLMKECAQIFVGEHDFKSFCQTGAQVESTVRTVYRVEILEEGRDLVVRVSGNGFLYNMVRIIVGTLLEVGQGRRMPEDMVQILEKKDRSAAGPTAPAHGLMLMKYEFL